MQLNKKMHNNWYKKFASAENWLIEIAKYIERLSDKLQPDEQGNRSENYKDIMDRIKTLIGLLREYDKQIVREYVPGQNKLVDVIKNFLSKVNENDPHDINNKITVLNRWLDMYS